MQGHSINASTTPEEDVDAKMTAARKAAWEHVQAHGRGRRLDHDTLHDDSDEISELDEPAQEENALSSAFLISYFVAGGAAGAASRTVVSPLERLKIIMQVQPKTVEQGNRGAYSGVIAGLRKMWQEEGLKGYMRGNGINCLRIAPYSAVQFSTYEILKVYLMGEEEDLDVSKRLFAGALAGIASVVSTYPLDLVRSRISIASASMYAEAKNATSSDQSNQTKPSREQVRKMIEERQKRVPGIWAMTVKVYQEEGGIRALYKGCVPTSLGVAPYVGINFAAVSYGTKIVSVSDAHVLSSMRHCENGWQMRTATYLLLRSCHAVPLQGVSRRLLHTHLTFYGDECK